MSRFHFSKSGILLLLSGCWAPEITPPEQTGAPKPSPRELQQQAGNRAPLTIVRHETPQISKDSPLDYNPPFTAWTNREKVSLYGPNGGKVMSIKNRGVRVDVLEINDNQVRIICSGCAPPKQNHGGWINRDAVNTEWDVPTGSPLEKVLQFRKDWSKSVDLPENIKDKRDLCMLVDNGFTITKGKAIWSIQGGLIEMKLQDETWEKTNLVLPQQSASATWRCDVKYPKSDG